MLNISIEKKMDTSSGEKILRAEITLERNSITTLKGVSGSGKTTLLRIISGLTCADKGSITYDEKIWYDSKKKIFLPPQERALGLLAQEYILFPNMTIEQNVLFAKKDKTAAEIMLDSFGLAKLSNKYPHQLSGGQKQRAALAMVLSQKPKLLLLDEPFSALDLKTRNDIWQLILNFQKIQYTTILVVSHDRYNIEAETNQTLMISEGIVKKELSNMTHLLDTTLLHPDSKNNYLQHFHMDNKANIIEQKDYISLSTISLN